MKIQDFLCMRDDVRFGKNLSHKFHIMHHLATCKYRSADTVFTNYVDISINFYLACTPESSQSALAYAWWK